MRYIVVDTIQLFLANDVASMLGYSNTRRAILNYCKEAKILCPKNTRSDVETDARTKNVRTSVDQETKDFCGVDASTDARTKSVRTSVDQETKEVDTEARPKIVGLSVIPLADVFRLINHSHLPAADACMDWTISYRCSIVQNSICSTEQFHTMTISEAAVNTVGDVKAVDTKLRIP